jgi:hypothetical protein
MVTSLSNYEMKLVTDPEVLLAKNRIIQKVYDIFGRLAFDYKNMVNTGRLLIENEIDGKISRGENYKGLPYVILDYPRQFSKVDVLAIRSFFWWGNFFSITLQLAGKYQHRYAGVIEKAIQKNLFEGWYVGCSDDPWEHHFANDNYTLIRPGIEYNISTHAHLKMAKKIPLDKWDEVDFFFNENFAFLMTIFCA